MGMLHDRPNGARNDVNVATSGRFVSPVTR
jgi:hypothetical protein